MIVSRKDRTKEGRDTRPVSADDGSDDDMVMGHESSNDDAELIMARLGRNIEIALLLKRRESEKQLELRSKLRQVGGGRNNNDFLLDDSSERSACSLATTDTSTAIRKKQPRSKPLLLRRASSLPDTDIMSVLRDGIGHPEANKAQGVLDHHCSGSGRKNGCGAASTSSTPLFDLIMEAQQERRGSHHHHLHHLHRRPRRAGFASNKDGNPVECQSPDGSWGDASERNPNTSPISVINDGHDDQLNDGVDIDKRQRTNNHNKHAHHNHRHSQHRGGTTGRSKSPTETGPLPKPRNRKGCKPLLRRASSLPDEMMSSLRTSVTHKEAKGKRAGGGKIGGGDGGVSGATTPLFDLIMEAQQTRRGSNGNQRRFSSAAELPSQDDNLLDAEECQSLDGSNTNRQIDPAEGEEENEEKDDNESQQNQQRRYHHYHQHEQQQQQHRHQGTGSRGRSRPTTEGASSNPKSDRSTASPSGRSTSPGHHPTKRRHHSPTTSKEKSACRGLSPALMRRGTSEDAAYSWKPSSNKKTMATTRKKATTQQQNEQRARKEVRSLSPLLMRKGTSEDATFEWKPSSKTMTTTQRKGVRSMSPSLELSTRHEEEEEEEEEEEAEDDEENNFLQNKKETFPPKTGGLLGTKPTELGCVSHRTPSMMGRQRGRPQSCDKNRRKKSKERCDRHHHTNRGHNKNNHQHHHHHPDHYHHHHNPTQAEAMVMYAISREGDDNQAEAILGRMPESLRLEKEKGKDDDPTSSLRLSELEGEDNNSTRSTDSDRTTGSTSSTILSWVQGSVAPLASSLSSSLQEKVTKELQNRSKNHNNQLLPDMYQNWKPFS